jgi:hypothetical protein
MLSYGLQSDPPVHLLRTWPGTRLEREMRSTALRNIKFLRDLALFSSAPLLLASFFLANHAHLDAAGGLLVGVIAAVAGSLTLDCVFCRWPFKVAAYIKRASSYPDAGPLDATIYLGHWTYLIAPFGRYDAQLHNEALIEALRLGWLDPDEEDQ